jgi:hypothetical protein
MDFVEKMAVAFEDEMKKIASAASAAAPIAKKSLLIPGLVAGSIGTLALQRAHRDWRMGRAMRVQNQSQGY